MKNGIKKILKEVSPGTELRKGLENILKAGTGGLIVIGDSEEIRKLTIDGFEINCDYSPAKLYELAKMDGAIILSYDTKKILFANSQLTPDPMVSSQETGIRHRTAERVAKQTGELVISVSQRRKNITLYKGDLRYSILDTSKILIKANQAIQTLERYKTVLTNAIQNLSALELDDLSTRFDVAKAIQRTELFMRVVQEIEMYMLELGEESRLINMQLTELTHNVKAEGFNTFKDYYRGDEEYSEAYKKIRAFSEEDIWELKKISSFIFGNAEALDEYEVPRGYRILSKIPRLPNGIIELMVKQFGDLNAVLDAQIDDLEMVDGIGEIRAKRITESLKKLHDRAIFENGL